MAARPMEFTVSWMLKLQSLDTWAIMGSFWFRVCWLNTLSDWSPSVLMNCGRCPVGIALNCVLLFCSVAN